MNEIWDHISFRTKQKSFPHTLYILERVLCKNKNNKYEYILLKVADHRYTFTNYYNCEFRKDEFNDVILSVGYENNCCITEDDAYVIFTENANVKTIENAFDFAMNKIKEKLNER